MFNHFSLLIHKEVEKLPLCKKHTHPNFWVFSPLSFTTVWTPAMSLVIWLGSLLFCVMSLESVFQIVIKRYKGTIKIRILNEHNSQNYENSLLT